MATGMGARLSSTPAIGAGGIKAGLAVRFADKNTNKKGHDQVMANRVIKESLKFSPSIDSLTWFEECLFYRLIVTVDDYGRYYAERSILKNVLFPKKSSVTEKSISDALSKMVEQNMVSLYRVGDQEYLQMTNWTKHQQVRNKRSKFPPPEQLQSIDINCNQLQSNANNCSRNPYPDPYPYPDPNPEPTRMREDAGAALINDSDARTIQGEHDRILTAAEDAGFPRTNSVRAGLLQLYARFGMDRLLYGISECVKYGASNLAYLEKCCEGGKKPEKAQANGRTVNAQQYEQRSYEAHEESVDEIMARLARGG